MLIKDFLDNVCNEIKYKPIRNDISEELNLHIQELKEDLKADGLSEKEAEEKAVFNMGDAQEIGKKLNKIHRPKLDLILLFLIIVLIGFGIMVSFIKVKAGSENLGVDTYYLFRHIIFLIIGIIISIVIYFFDYRKLNKYSDIIFVLSTILMIFILMFGTFTNGKKVAIYIMGIKISVYICIYLYTIAFIGFINNFIKDDVKILKTYNITLRLNKTVMKLIIVAIISTSLFVVLNHTVIACLMGLTYLIISTLKIITLKENIKKNIFKLYGAILILGICFSIFIILTQPHIYYKIKERLVPTFYDDTRGTGYIGYKINEIMENSNLLTGVDNIEEYMGLFDEGTNHSLVTIIAYKGIIYSAIIILTIILLSLRLIVDSKKIKDEYGNLLIIGLSCIILLQALVNILMNFGIIPIVAMNLPFVSYGIGELLVNMMSISLILSIYRRKDILVKNDENNKKLKIKIFFE